MKKFFTVDKAAIDNIEQFDGFLRARITIARPGVFPYIVQSDTGQEVVMHKAKLPEDLFTREALDSASGAPITNEHPKDGSQVVLVDNRNSKNFVSGSISAPQIIDNAIEAQATIYDSELIEDVLNGEKEQASIGFVYEEDATPGEYAGVKYDSIQRNIRINHVAMVPKGRAGDKVKIHFDCSDMSNTEEKQMGKKWMEVDGAGNSASNPQTLTYRAFDGTDRQVSPEIHAEFQAWKSKNGELEKKAADAQKEIEGLKKKIEEGPKQAQDAKSKELQVALDAEKAKVEGLQKQVDGFKDSFPKKVAEAVKERRTLEKHAEDAGISYDGLKNRELKLQIIGKELPFPEGKDVDAVDETVIDARYDAAVELMHQRANEQKASRDGAGNFDVDSYVAGRSERMRKLHEGGKE